MNFDRFDIIYLWDGGGGGDIHYMYIIVGRDLPIFRAVRVSSLKSLE